MSAAGRFAAKVQPWHLAAFGAGVVVIAAWAVMSKLRAAYKSGALNPASAENIAYKAASVPFSGSLGVWLWEVLHPEEANAATNATTAAKVQAQAKAKAKATQAAKPAASKPLEKLPVDATGTGGW